MAFTGNFVTLACLAKMELPARTLYLSDGGLVKWGAETYAGDDSEFGSLAALDELTESAGDIAPGSTLTLIPKSGIAAATLSQPAYQNSRVRLYVAEVDPATGLTVGTPEMLFDSLLDTTVLRSDRGTRLLDLGLVSRAEKLFMINEGNCCSPRFHKSVWPGETGFDNATGASVTVAWGTAAPPRGSVNAGSGGGYGFNGRPGGIDPGAYENFVLGGGHIV